MSSLKIMEMKSKHMQNESKMKARKEGEARGKEYED